MIRHFFGKLKSIFKKQRSAAIPFAERSREAVRNVPYSETDKKERSPRFDPRNAGTKSDKPSRTPAPRPRDQRPKSEKPARTSAPKPREPRPQPEKQETLAPWSIDDFKVPPAEGKVRFHDLDLPPSILHAVADLNFQYCTPVQAGILPQALSGKDAIGQAQTGTGKSAAFLITIFTHMFKHPVKGGPPKGQPRALILAPTRELVLQIEKDALDLSKYTPFKILSVFGGMGYEKQTRALKEKSFDVIVATPGRLIDFKNKQLIKLDKVEILVLDEADRMLDMGFIPDVRKIVYSTPHKDQRQTFFYSATFTPEVTRLAEQWTREPCKVEIEPEHVAAESVRQVIYITTTSEKFSLLYNLITQEKLERVLVFTNRRDQARDLSRKLSNHGISTALISGEIQQNKRIRALEDFREGKCRVLVATDVAARGLHVDDISHVINYNLPQDPESYVHRIGRTGRAGTQGISVSFACEDDSFHIPDIEAFLGNDLVCEHPDDCLLADPPAPVRNAGGDASDRVSDPKRKRSRTRRPRSEGGDSRRPPSDSGDAPSSSRPPRASGPRRRSRSRRPSKPDRSPEA
ncbi:ATP-dependent RNA helicase RhlB [Desulfatiferula olefinivorans]